MTPDEFAFVSRTGQTHASYAAHHMYDPPGITEEKVSLTASWLRMVVWGQATNPASKPVITAMADATAIHAWASLRILATALYDLEALTCGIDGGAARNVATRALEFTRQALDECG